MKGIKLRATALGFVFLVAACVSAPEATKTAPQGTPPDWVLTPPAEDSQFMYFTGSGASKTASLAEAEEAARIELIDGIMRFMGIRITAETTATARASVDSFQSDVTQTLTSQSSGRISGLEITERWADRKDPAVTLYLLARYRKAELLKEKSRLEAVFREQVEAVSGPEREAQELEAGGQHYQAAVKYIEAAAAAYKSDLENAKIKFERNVTAARAAIGRIGLLKVNDSLSTFVGEAFAQPLAVKVVGGSTDRDPGVAGVPVKFSYKQLQSSGRKAVRSESVATDAEGLARFQHPAPEFVGLDTVTAAVDLSAALETLESAPKDLLAQVDSLEEVALSKKVVFAIESVSRARVIPTGVALFDLDASGSPIVLRDSSSGLLESLTRSSFQVRSLPVDFAAVAGASDAQIIELLKKSYGTQVGRAIYGTARISSHEQDGQFIIVSVTGSVKVVDLLEEKVLLAVNRTKRAQGSNAAAALSTAFKTLGEDFGEYIKNSLR
jgi:hypothetical protein